MKLAAVALVLAIGVGSASADPRIRVLSYNIHHGEGKDGKVDLARLAAIIRAEEPDVVCLQEVDKNIDRSGRLDMPAEMAKALDMQMVFGPNLELQGGHYGNATFTKLKILANENIRLPIPRNDEPRGCLRARLEVDGQTFDVYNTHFGLTEPQRRMQASTLMDRLGSILTIVAGDLNAPPDETAVKTLTGILTDTFGAGVAEAKEQRIDYVLVSRHVNPLSFRVVVTPETEVASDHYPVVADVGLEAPAGGVKAESTYDANDERIKDAVGE